MVEITFPRKRLINLNLWTIFLVFERFPKRFTELHLNAYIMFLQTF
jgi:transposase